MRLLGVESTFISRTDVVGVAVRTTSLFKKRKSALRRDPVFDHIRVLDAIESQDAAKAEQVMGDSSSWLGTSISTGYLES